MVVDFANGFHATHHRWPTFWLDKVCIDQNNIGDGLKVLPVNVMACKKMLCLCGPTYTQRLWCAWELFTLFSFSSFKQAVSRVEIVFLLSTFQKEERQHKLDK